MMYFVKSLGRNWQDSLQRETWGTGGFEEGVKGVFVFFFLLYSISVKVKLIALLMSLVSYLCFLS